MAISLEEVKRLKELTGVGLTDAKTALAEAGGDFDKALEAMRKKGLTKAEKRGEREAKEGLVDAYVHSGRIGVVVEVNCETDFVARTDDFKNLTHDIAMHVAATNPLYISAEDIPAEERERITAEFTEQATDAAQDPKPLVNITEGKVNRFESPMQGKSPEIIAKIVDGRVKKYFAEQTLLEQPFIKNPDQTVGQLVQEHNAKLGENIVVSKIRRVELGVSE